MTTLATRGLQMDYIKTPVVQQRGCSSECSSEDEVLSVGSESPPPPPPMNLSPLREDVEDTYLGSSNSSSCTAYTNSRVNNKGHDGAGDVKEQIVPCVVNNTNANPALKFSIANILKPEFGSRLATPIYKFPPKKKTLPTLTAAPIDLTAPAVAKDKVDVDPTLSKDKKSEQPLLWPAWVYCTRYSDRPSSGRSPRSRRVKRQAGVKGTTQSDGSSKDGSQGPGGAGGAPGSGEEKRPRTAFSGEQLARLKLEFQESRYLTERRRQELARELDLNEAQIKIWFQNKRAKIKKASGQKNPLALQLMAQGLYNHSTIPLTREEEEQAAQAELNSRD